LCTYLLLLLLLLCLQEWRGMQLQVIVGTMRQPLYFSRDMQLNPQQLMRRLQHWREQQEIKQLIQRLAFSDYIDENLPQNQQQQEEGEPQEQEMYVRAVAVADLSAAAWSGEQQQWLRGSFSLLQAQLQLLEQKGVPLEEVMGRDSDGQAQQQQQQQQQSGTLQAQVSSLLAGLWLHLVAFILQ
jgi:hypothetical protein